MSKLPRTGSRPCSPDTRAAADSCACVGGPEHASLAAVLRSPGARRLERSPDSRARIPTRIALPHVRRTGLLVCGLVIAAQLAVPDRASAGPSDLLHVTSMVLPHLETHAARRAGRGRLLPVPRRLDRLPRRARPAPLVPLYVSFGSLQVLDVHSTRRALVHGHQEANPLLAPIARNRAALLAVKAAATAGTIVGVERLWKANRAAAVATMLALNVGYALVVRANYQRVRANP